MYYLIHAQGLHVMVLVGMCHDQDENLISYPFSSLVFLQNHKEDRVWAFIDTLSR